MATDVIGGIREALAARHWPATATFETRLGELRRLVQERSDRLPRKLDFLPRVPIVLPLLLDDLALALPPSEQGLLEHLRARRPLRALLGTHGFHSVSRLNHRLQRLLSRIHAYCGSAVRHRLMQPYDRPGHDHRRRPGRPRRLRPADEFPALLVWVPRRFAMARGYLLKETQGGRTHREARRAARRLIRSRGCPDQYTIARRA